LSTEEERKHKKGSPVSPGRDSLNHNHAFITMANVADNHQHVIVGTTGPGIYSGNTHVHRICIRTSFDPKGNTPHWHLVDDMTGPAIEVPGGEHTHYFSGQTSYDDGHRHNFSGVTDSSPENNYDDDHCDYDREQDNHE